MMKSTILNCLISSNWDPQRTALKVIVLDLPGGNFDMCWFTSPSFPKSEFADYSRYGARTNS